MCFVGMCFVGACFVGACFVGMCFVGACLCKVGKLHLRQCGIVPGGEAVRSAGEVARSPDKPRAPPEYSASFRDFISPGACEVLGGAKNLFDTPPAQV